MEKPFSEYLTEAIELHRRRGEYYAGRTEDRSRALTRRLIWGLRASQPVARYFDWRARPFHKDGIPIIRDDLVSFIGVEPAETPPRYRGRALPYQIAALEGMLVDYRTQLATAIGLDDWRGAALMSHYRIKDLRELEGVYGCHFAMTSFLIEAIGLAATNAMRFAKMSNGETAGLSRRLVTLESAALSWAVGTDAKAQALHGDGIGVLVNEMPKTKFRQALARVERQRRAQLQVAVSESAQAAGGITPIAAGE